MKARRRQGCSSLMTRKLRPAVACPSAGFRADLRFRFRPDHCAGGFDRSALHMPVGVWIITVRTCRK